MCGMLALASILVFSSASTPLRRQPTSICQGACWGKLRLAGALP
jgi:hypothetical protein